MNCILVTAWYWFGEHARMRERIEGYTNLERLLLGSHPDDFRHETL